MFSNTKESGLESLIVKWLVEQNHYEQGHSHDYSMEYALDTARLLRFLKDTQPEAVEKLQLETHPLKRAQFLSRVRDEITKHHRCAAQGRQGLPGQPGDVLHDAQRE